MTQPRKTWAEVLKAAAGHLSARGVDEPRAVCDLLAARLLNCKPLELCLRHNEAPPETLLEAMRRGVRRVAGGEPVQYVIGRVEFMGHVFKTDRRALIPRPETELLVEKALEDAALWHERPACPPTAPACPPPAAGGAGWSGGAGRPVVVDVGTGCGCIAASLALRRPNALYLAVDTSPEALELARENAARLGVGDRIGFSEQSLSDLLDPGSTDAIVSNPPYVPTAAYERLPRHIRSHEPRQALDGGPVGTAVIETVIQDASIALKQGGRLLMEIGADQGAKVASMLKEWEFHDIAISRDLAGHDRVVRALRAE